MALPILDGNQTAATLSTVLTSGEHIPVHTVVSLGSQAITDFRSAVSGSVVSISNFPASQSTTFGAVTGSVSVLNFPSTQTIAGTVTANVQGTITAGMLLVENANNSFPNQNPPVQLSADPQGGSLRVRLDYNPIADAQPNSSSVIGRTDVLESGNNAYIKAKVISGTVTVGNSVTIGSLPAISGTVTANGGNFLNADNALITKDSASNIVLVGGLNYSATPTQSAIDAIRTDGNGAVVVYSSQTNWTDTNAGNQTRSASQQTPFPVQILGGSVTVGSLPAISGTVTANNPNGALTTRFGSVVTANLAFITSAVTNTSRKYLLAQNISGGTVTIGIGFSPTTTQGIQLTAGGGLTFDSFCPTGAVYWLGAVTGAAFTILEG